MNSDYSIDCIEIGWGLTDKLAAFVLSDLAILGNSVIWHDFQIPFSVVELGSETKPLEGSDCLTGRLFSFENSI